MRLEEFNALRHTIDTPMGPLGYAEAGTGAAALFVHGVGTNAYLWSGVVDELRGERRCIAVDLPAHGHSGAPTHDLSLGAIADHVAAFCEALDLPPVDLVANDTGGAIAQIFAARHPERLHTFALTNCDTHDNVPPEVFAPTVELAKRGELAPTAGALLADLDTARAAVFGTGFEDPMFLSTDVVRDFLEPLGGTPERALQFERMIAKLEPSDLLAAEPALARLTVPTLVVWGTGDDFFDVKWAHWLRDTIPGVAEIVELDGAKLFFPLERPADLVPHLRRHWARAEARAAS
ncbi:MAG TPA: alpha/beta hydrolase [Acidimicrobiia bacterium]|jgi:pimeloyl-ACP methyl ester carboxylesterase|nr:alpha/beta hydrolase [Acidimicrobiia bacterium]